jgi:hypothetical protein
MREALWAIAVMVLVVIGAAPAFAQDSGEPSSLIPSIQGVTDSKLDVKARPLFDGHVRQGGWGVVSVKVRNRGTEGNALVRTRSTASGGSTHDYVRAVELPEGANKEVLVYYRIGLSGGVREVSLNMPPGREEVVEFKTQVLPNDGVLIAVVGRDGHGIQTIREATEAPVPSARVREYADAARPVRMGLVEPTSMPERTLGWSTADWVVWSEPTPGTITAEQLAALRGHVADGGHLLVTVSDNWRSVASSPFAEMLPVELTGVHDGSLRGLPGVVTTDVAPIATATLREVEGRQAWQLATNSEGDLLWAAGTYGLGTVHVVLADPGVEPLSSVQRSALWRSLLYLPAVGTGEAAYGASLDFRTAMRMHVNPNCQQAMGTEFSWDGTESGTLSAIKDKLGDIPGVAPLPMSWLLAFSLVYLFAIGPFDYFLLRALNRQPATWITFPIYIVVFSAIALVGTSMAKGSQAVLTRVEVVDVLPGSGLWRGNDHIGVFSTRKADLTVRSGFDNSLIMPLSDGGFMTSPVIHSDRGPGAIGYRANTWTLGYMHSGWVVEGGPIRARVEGDHLVLINDTGRDLTASHVVYRNNRYPIGDFGAGERIDVDMGAGQPLSFDEATDGGWAMSTLREFDELAGGHLHDTDRPTLMGVLDEPVEPLRLEGMWPVPKTVTVLRAPLVLAEDL